MGARVLRLSDEVRVAADLKTSAPKEAQLEEPPLPSLDEKPLKEMNRFDILHMFDTKSDAIRALAAEGMTVKEIRDKLDLRYQHVRNVLNYHLKRKGRNQ